MSAATCLLTGASRGIGRAAALELARKGVDSIFLGRESPELTETAQLVGALGRQVWIHQAELAQADSVVRAMDVILRQHGAPAIVINNAGTITRELVESTTDDMWEEQLGVNLRAPFLITRALLPAMKSAGKGRLLYVGSIASTLGTPRASAYCASKWGLVGFMKSVAEELRDTGLMAMAVLPGSVDTQMLVGSGFPPRITPFAVAETLAYYALSAPLSHNGGVVEMFGI